MRKITFTIANDVMLNELAKMTNQSRSNVIRTALMIYKQLLDKTNNNEKLYCGSDHNNINCELYLTTME